MRVNVFMMCLFMFYIGLCFAQTDDGFVDITIPDSISEKYNGDYKIKSGDSFETIINAWAVHGGYKPYMKLGNYGGIKNLIVPIDVVFFDNIVDSLDSFIDKINRFDLLASDNVYLHACLYQSSSNPTLLIQVNTNVCP